MFSASVILNISISFFHNSVHLFHKASDQLVSECNDWLTDYLEHFPSWFLRFSFDLGKMQFLKFLFGLSLKKKIAISRDISSDDIT